MNSIEDGEAQQHRWRSQLPPLTDASPASSRSALTTPDRRDGAVYVLDESLMLAVDVALATGRPLLLRGEPGSGKSSLAAFIARNLNWRYYEHVVTARTRARDLLYTFDAVRKLADASTPARSAASLEDDRYVEPGVLWWAFDREAALRRGIASDRPAPQPAPVEPDAEMNEQRSSFEAVVLVDEIDKADPDLPNGLLVPLGSGEFRISETGVLVSQFGRDEADTDTPSVSPSATLLVVITTNEERELPPAFLRRCVIYSLTAPNSDRLVEIGWAHLHSEGVESNPDDEELILKLASRTDELRQQANELGRRRPSTAEFLDAVHACRQLGISVGANATWSQLEKLVLLKHDAVEDGL